MLPRTPWTIGLATVPLLVVMVAGAGAAIADSDANRPPGIVLVSFQPGGPNHPCIECHSMQTLMKADIKAMEELHGLNLRGRVTALETHLEWLLALLGIDIVGTGGTLVLTRKVHKRLNK